MHIPRAIRFKTRPQIALEQIRAALLAGVSSGVDASYGSNSALRLDITGLGLSYVAPVRRLDRKPRRLSVEALALNLPKHAWRTATWREGTNKRLQSRFARARVRVAPMRGEARFAEETLLIEWPEGEVEPTKYWRMAGTSSNWENDLESWPKPFSDRLGHKARRQVSTLYVAGADWPRLVALLQSISAPARDVRARLTRRGSP